MDPLTTTAAAGMRSRLETLDLLANNLANVSSPGFKADREAYSLYMAEESLLASEEGGIPQTSAPVIETHHTDYAQGLLTTTGNSTDLALSGTFMIGICQGKTEISLGRPLRAPLGRSWSFPAGVTSAILRWQAARHSFAASALGTALED